MMVNSFSWYEAGLPASERKRRGHYSTPLPLVEQILDTCGYTSDQDLTHLRVLDPACGSGNFLVSATRRLLASGCQRGLSPRQLATALKKNIWGFDPDPVACFLAAMQLRETFAQLLEQYQQPSASIEASTIATPISQHQSKKTRLPHPARLVERLHIHQADGLAFPWEQCQGKFDLFVANPPYLAAKNTDLSHYCSTHQRGQADSYLLFLNLALQMVRPAGWLALIVPDPLLARVNAAVERQRLLSETTLHHLWHLSDVFPAYVGAAIIIAQKGRPDSSHFLQWKRGAWNHVFPHVAQKKRRTRYVSEREESLTRNASLSNTSLATPPLVVSSSQSIAQSLLQQQSGAELRYLLSCVKGDLVERLATSLQSEIVYKQEKLTAIQTGPFVLLGQLVNIRRGEEIGKDSPLLQFHYPPAQSINADDQEMDWYPVLRGGVDLRPYSPPIAQCWIPRSSVKKSLDRYKAAKLLVIKSAGRLQATLDLEGHVVLQTLYLLHLAPSRPYLCCDADEQTFDSDEDELYFLLALLNSRLLQMYVYVLYTAYKWVQPQIEQHVLTRLPIPTIASREIKEQIIQRARRLMMTGETAMSVVELQRQRDELDEQQECAIRDLYTQALNALSGQSFSYSSDSDDCDCRYSDETPVLF